MGAFALEIRRKRLLAGRVRDQIGAWLPEEVISLW